MSSHFKFYDGASEVVPWSAKYAYPTQANRTWKSITKLPPVNATTFDSTSNPNIQINLPAQGYLDTTNSYLQFDVEITGTTAVNAHFQNDIQSIFKRARIQYGSLPCEDINEYGTLMRFLSETTGTNQDGHSDQTSVCEGKGGITYTWDTTGKNLLPINSRLFNTQATSMTAGSGVALSTTRALDVGNVITTATTNPWAPTSNTTTNGGVISAKSIVNGKRRYCIQLGFGLFVQNKLLPLKWMASQLSIHLTLAQAIEVIACSAVPSSDLKFTLTDVCFNAQLIEFDGSYDAAFLDGLRTNGVPIKFASWNQYYSNAGGSSNATFSFPERNRSIKAAFCVQNPVPKYCTTNLQPYDSHTFVQSSLSGEDYTTQGYSSGILKQFHWRVGGKYYPSQPVKCTSDNTTTNGAAEAYSELEKALNIVGDYRLSTGINAHRWCEIESGNTSKSNLLDWSGIDNGLVAVSKDFTDHSIFGPSCFAISGDFETSDGSEVSGINGEEQNDIALMIEWSTLQNPAFTFKTFIYYDALLILRENNQVELIK